VAGLKLKPHGNSGETCGSRNSSRTCHHVPETHGTWNPLVEKEDVCRRVRVGQII